MKQGINLIPASVLTSRARRRRVRAWIVVDTLVGGLVAAVLAVSHPEASGLVDRLRAEQDTARATLASAQENLAGTVSSLRAARVREAVAQRLGARPDFSGLLRTIAGELDDRATLDQILIAPLPVDEAPVVAVAAPSPNAASATAEGNAPPPPPRPRREQYRVLITGMATSAGIASEFVLRLEGTGYFSSVALTSTTGRDVGEIRAVDFRITGVLGEGRLAVVPEAPAEGETP